jgi:tetratricopeptide (TPR) repeat protein
MRRHANAFGLCVSLVALMAYHPSAIAQDSGQSLLSRQELQIRVLDDQNLGVRALINLGIDELQQQTAYTDWSGNTTFRGLTPGTYTLLIKAAGGELYRSQLTLKSGEGSRSEVVRLHNVILTERTDKVSVNDLRVPSEAYKYYLTGITAIRAGNLEKALQSLDMAVMIYPAHSKSHNARGVVLHMAQRIKEAEGAFRNAIKFDAYSLEPRLNLGNLLLESNRPSEAKLELWRAVELEPENMTAIELLVESMLMTRDEVSAAALVRSLHGRNARHSAGLHLGIASALTDHGMIDLAIEQCSLVLQDGPTFSERLEAEAFLSRLRNQ